MIGGCFLVGLVCVVGCITGRDASVRVVTPRSVRHQETASIEDLRSRFQRVERVYLYDGGVGWRVAFLDRHLALSNPGWSKVEASASIRLVQVLHGEPQKRYQVELRQSSKPAGARKAPADIGLFRLLYNGPYERDIYVAYNDWRDVTLIEHVVGLDPAPSPTAPSPESAGLYRSYVYAAARALPRDTLIGSSDVFLRPVFPGAPIAYGRWVRGPDYPFDSSLGGRYARCEIEKGELLLDADLGAWTPVLVATNDIEQGQPVRNTDLAPKCLGFTDRGPNVGSLLDPLCCIHAADRDGWRAARNIRSGMPLAPGDIVAEYLFAVVDLPETTSLARDHFVKKMAHPHYQCSLVSSRRIGELVGANLDYPVKKGQPLECWQVEVMRRGNALRFADRNKSGLPSTVYRVPE